jgi:hypothetical protein
MTSRPSGLTGGGVFVNEKLAVAAADTSAPHGGRLSVLCPWSCHQQPPPSPSPTDPAGSSCRRRLIPPRGSPAVTVCPVGHPLRSP